MVKAGNELAAREETCGGSGRLSALGSRLSAHARRLTPEPSPRAESREPESDPVVVLYADSSGVVNCVKSGMSASERHQPRAGRTATMKDAAGFGTVA